jgi:hypothetical protein
MNLESASVLASLLGVGFILLSIAAQIGSALTQSDLSQFTSWLNLIGFGLMSGGAGGLIYVVMHGG